MIIELLLIVLDALFSFIFNIVSVPNIEGLSDFLSSSINTLFGYIQNSLGLLFVFIRPSTFIVALTTAIALINLEHIWNFVIWVLKKIPFIGIK